VQLALFVIFYVKQRYLLSSVFLALAIAAKLYPVVFLLLFIADKRYKEALYLLFLVVILSVVCLLPTQGGLVANLNYILSGFSGGSIYSGSISFVTEANNQVQRGMSLFTLLKMLCIWTGRMDTMDFHALVLPYYAVMLATGLLVAIYVVFFESELWKKVTLLTLAVLLLPHLSADYKLIHLFLPLCLFVNADSRFKYDRLFVWLFALLLIPKSYYYFQSVASDSSTNDISIAVPINIALLSLMLVLLLGNGLGRLRGQPWLAQSKAKLLEHLALARSYALPLAVLALIGCGLIYYSAFGMRDYKDFWRKVHVCADLCTHGKYAECLAACDKLIAANQGTADVYYIASSAKIGLGQYDEAMRAAEKALTLAPDFRLAAENYYRARAALNPRPGTAQ
jgi:tetratricopeptide (TPR) repeat protein